jgi:predicted small metal-binding protein
MRELRCADAGFDCGAVIQGENDDEVMAKAAEHAREAHGIDEMDEAAGQQIKALIHDA